MDQGIDGETTDSVYSVLYKLGGVAALVVAVLTLGEVIVFAFYPQPGTITDWFILFQNNKLIGILDFWGLEVPMYAMFLLIFLALYRALSKASPSWMAIAFSFALVGIGIFFATNNPFSMLSLSNQYAVATTDAQRSTFLAAGRAILTYTNQRAVGGFNMSLFLVSVAGLIVSLVMLKSKSFSRLTAYVGILANGLSIADYLREALSSSAMVAMLVILPNALFIMIWSIMVGRRLYHIGSLTGKKDEKRL